MVTHRGFKLVLRFAEGDFAGEGLVQKIELLPDTEELKLGVLRPFAPDAELYLAYARAAMRIFGPDDTPEIRVAKLRDSAEALRPLARPSRRLPNKFYETIALEYKALVEGGEKNPVTALGEKHGVVISAASHWLREARTRGLLPEKVKKEASDASQSTRLDLQDSEERRRHPLVWTRRSTALQERIPFADGGA